MTEQDLKRLGELLELMPATSWGRKAGYRFVLNSGDGEFLATITADPDELGDAVLEFISLARNLMPELLAAALEAAAEAE